MPRRTSFDRWLLFTCVVLALGGLFMVGSATAYAAMTSGRSAYHYVVVHLVHVAVAAAAFVTFLFVPYQRLADRWVVAALVAVSWLSLAAVLLMPAAGGARRWFRVGPVALQPSELAKLAAVVFLAYLLSRRETEVNDLKRVVAPTAMALGPMAFLIVIEPDLGSSFMLALTAFVMLFVAGLRWKYVGAVAGAGLLGVVGAVIAEPYRMQRILTFLNPAEDTQKSGFQLAQSLIALGSGGVIGTGWGQGQQKAFYLPAAHTDFIYSVVGEELGLGGTIFLLAAFLVLFWRGMRAAAGAPDRFGYYLALGIASLVAFQALIHMGVCIGILPTKGLPLPLVSHGGSSLVATMAALGVLVNVSRHSN